MERQLLRMHSSHFCILNLYLRDFFLVMTKARRLYPLLIDCQNQCPAPGVGGEEEQRVRWVTVPAGSHSLGQMWKLPWARPGSCCSRGRAEQRDPSPARPGAELWAMGVTPLSQHLPGCSRAALHPPPSSFPDHSRANLGGDPFISPRLSF